MPTGKRAVRVGDQILREMAFLLLSKVKDPRVSGVTFTGIRLSNDLKIARVFFSVIGEADTIERARKGLDSAKGFLKRHVGESLDLKFVPEIRFEYDPSLEKGSRMEQVLRDLHPGGHDNEPQ